MRSAFTHENEWWYFFGYGSDWPADKCSRCLSLVENLKKPNRYCIDCWKLEIFFSNCVDLDRMKKFLLDAAREDHRISGKWLKEPMELDSELRSKLTSVPSDGHPDREVKSDGAILIYTRTIKERDERVRQLLTGFKKNDLYKKESISYRRGCLNFDDVIGPWKQWWPLDKDYSGVNEVVGPDRRGKLSPKQQ